MRAEPAEMELQDRRAHRALLDLLDHKADQVSLDDRENLAPTDVPDLEERGEKEAEMDSAAFPVQTAIEEIQAHKVHRDPLVKLVDLADEAKQALQENKVPLVPPDL